MNRTRRWILSAFAAAVACNGLFPPRHYGEGRQFVLAMDYGPDVHVSLLLAQWLGLAVIATVCFILAGRGQPRAQAGNVAAPTAPDSAPTCALREASRRSKWALSLLGAVLVAATAWHYLFAQLPPPGPFDDLIPKTREYKLLAVSAIVGAGAGAVVYAAMLASRALKARSKRRAAQDGQQKPPLRS